MAKRQDRGPDLSGGALSWLVLDLYRRITGDPEAELAVVTLTEAWGEIGLRQADLVQGVVVLTRNGRLSMRQAASGPILSLTEKGLAYLRENEDLGREILADDSIASAMKRAGSRSNDKSPGESGHERRGGFR